MPKSETVIRELLSLADVEINGSNPWDIQIHDSRFYDRVLRDASLGLGESYMAGWWDCAAIDQMITRVLKARLDEKVRNETRYIFQATPGKVNQPSVIIEGF